MIDNHNRSEKYAKSLNRSLRKRQLQKITVQNANILRRIQTCQPTFRVEDWERDYLKSKAMVYNISEYKEMLKRPLGALARPASSMGFYKSLKSGKKVGLHRCGRLWSLVSSLSSLLPNLSACSRVTHPHFKTRQHLPTLRPSTSHAGKLQSTVGSTMRPSTSHAGGNVRGGLGHSHSVGIVGAM